MDHVVYLDHKAKELDHLISGEKSMIIRGGMGRKYPYGKLSGGHKLFFIENKGDGLVKAKAVVSEVFNSEMLSKEESVQMVEQNQSRLCLNDAMRKRFAGKRYLVLITIKDFEQVPAFKIDRSDYGNMDDWLPVEDINKVKK